MRLSISSRRAAMREARRDREALAERAGRGVEEGEALHRVRVAVEDGVGLAEAAEIVHRERAPLVALARRAPPRSANAA